MGVYLAREARCLLAAAPSESLLAQPLFGGLVYERSGAVSLQQIGVHGDSCPEWIGYISPWSSGWPGCLFLPGGGRGRSGTTVPATCLRRGRRLRRSGSVLPIPVVLPRAVRPLALALPVSIPPTGGSIPRIWVTLSWGRRVVGVYHVRWNAGLPAEIGDVDLGLGRRIDPHRTLERRWAEGLPSQLRYLSCTVGAYWIQKQLVTTQHSWLGHLAFPRAARMCQKGLRSCHVSYMTCHLYS